MKSRKTIVRIVKIVLMVAGALFIAQHLAMVFLSPGDSEAGQPFNLTPVRRGDIRITVSSTGSLAAVGTVNVGTQVSGTIEKLFVDYNDHVEKGQVLATLDQSLYQAAYAEASSAVATAKAQYHQAEAEVMRNKPLAEKEYISKEEYLSIETQMETAKATLNSAQASLNRARTNLSYTTIRSPIDGTVIERSVEQGQTLAASLEAPTMFVIAEDLSKMQIEADVDESDIGQIKQGQQVEFEVGAYPDRIFTGTVVQIRLQPEVISNVVMYTVVIDAGNKDGVLLPGMTATVEFIVSKQSDVLYVPDSALHVHFEHDTQYPLQKPQSSAEIDHAGDRARLFILAHGGEPKPVEVETGISDGTNTVVVSDQLSEGEMAVVGFQSEPEEAKRGLFSRLMPRPPGPKRKEGR